MVLKNRPNNGFNGYRFPIIPRAPRSLRKRVSHKKLVDDGQISAFELLAAVAGKLLQESESSASSNAADGKVQFGIPKDGIKQEVIEVKTVKSECHDQGSCIESASLPELAALHRILKSTVKELPHTESNSVLQRTSVITTDLSNKVGCDVKLKICKNQYAVGNIPSKPDGGSPDDGNSFGCIENEGERQFDAVEKKAGDLTVDNACCLKDPIELCVNSHMLINSDCSVQLPLYRDPVPNASFPRHRNDVNIITRDDDENSFRFNQPNKLRAFRPQSRMGHRRIRKMLTSRYLKVAPKLKDYELANTGRGLKPYYRKRKPIYTRERYQSEAPSKRKKLFNHSLTVAYDPDASSESISNSPEKGVMGDKSLSSTNSHTVGVTSPGARHRVHFQSKGPPVKLSIKSLRVPELYIEVPETTTVGSLKRTVLEAVTAILGDELRIGVLLQGKKVRDDNRTLQQTGISRSSDLNTLGFMLEPSFTQASSPLSQKDSPFLLPCDAHKQSSRFPASPNLDSGFFNASFDPALTTNLDNHLKNNQENVHSPIDATTDVTLPESKALVLFPPTSVDVLDVVPLNQKNKRSELSQRRTRRPFSVSEVEALVAAVEKLGTGRWRDVKIRSFDDANHRTYVDLKDKWKTLVHTASIAPQQRRGQPVPQELLDRVLAAHAYWSQHQSKQQGKLQIEPLIETGI